MRPQAGPQTVYAQHPLKAPRIISTVETEGSGMGIPEGVEGWSIRVQWGQLPFRRWKSSMGGEGGG